jgi:hypothetical protein
LIHISTTTTRQQILKRHYLKAALKLSDKLKKIKKHKWFSIQLDGYFLLFLEQVLNSGYWQQPTDGIRNCNQSLINFQLKTFPDHPVSDIPTLLLCLVYLTDLIFMHPMCLFPEEGSHPQ